MKYIITINQAAAVKVAPELDFNDLAILDFIRGFAASGKCESITDGGKTYFWISHSLIMSELPLLHISTKMGIMKRINKLIKANFLIKHSNCDAIGKTLYAFGDAVSLLETSTKNPQTNIDTPETKVYTPQTKVEGGYKQKFMGGINKSLGNHIYNNINNINDYNNESENEFSQAFSSFNQNENSFFYENRITDGKVNQSTLNTEEETPDPQYSAAPPTPDAATQRETDAETLREFWNATLVSEGFPTVKKLNAQRITKAAQVVREMVKDGVTAEQLFDKIKNSDFLRSGSKSWFSFDWLIQKRARQFDANWKIIMSGKYDNAPSVQKKAKETPAHLKIDPEFAIKFLNNDF